MPDEPPNSLRAHLKKHAPELATYAEALWLRARPLHDRQNRPDSNENGRRHVERVEQNIWRLLTETRDTDGNPNIDNLKPREIFLLSAAACCHDFDKALKSDQPLPEPFEHGESSGAFVVKYAAALGLDEHQAKETAAAIGIHNLKAGNFEKKLKTLSTKEESPDGPFNLRRIAVLLKAADILHCDYSRIQDIGINPDNLAEDKDEAERKLARSKYFARKCTKGWMPDGSRILIQADPDTSDKLEAFSAAFQYMKASEWKAVADDMDRWGFPHRLALHDDTAKLVKLPGVDESQMEPEPTHDETGLADLLQDYPEPQPKWVGRGIELAELHTAWLAGGTRMYAVVGFGGEGKTALARRFTESLRRQDDATKRPVVVWWSFYFNKAADAFFEAALTHFNIPLTEQGRPLAAEQRARKLVDLLREGVAGRRLLLVLDGLETLQDDTPGREGRVTDTGIRELLRATLDDSELDAGPRGMILITTREPLRDLRREADPRFGEITLEELSTDDGAALLTREYQLKIEQDDAEQFVNEVGGHALTLTLTGSLLSEAGATAVELAELRSFIGSKEAEVIDPNLTTRREKYHRLPGYVLRHCAGVLDEQERQFLRLLGCCVRPATRQDVEQVFLHPIKADGDDKPLNDELAKRDYLPLRNKLIARLVRLRLIHGKEDTGYNMHPLVRQHFYREEQGAAALNNARRKVVHGRFFDKLVERPEKRYPDTMEEMKPLIDAVQHGCRAGRADAALRDCYYSRIGRRDQPLRTTFYLTSDLGAVETELELLRGFFPDGEFSSEPIVTNQGDKAYLISAAALSLSITGRPDLAIPLFQRGMSASLAPPPDWSGANADCQNLCQSHMRLGGLADAAEAAANALDYADKMHDEHQFKNVYTQFSHGFAAKIAALRDDDETASNHFAAAIKLVPVDWLASLPGCWHCAWLARRGEFDRARPAAEKNAEVSEQVGDLPSQTFALATQALIERLAWAADDPDRPGLEVMARYARQAVETGRRSGHHFFLTCALLEAGRCAVTCAQQQPPDRPAYVAEATRHLDEAEQRAADAGYSLILADIHVARARLAKLAGDTEGVQHHCRKAVAICDAPDCGYAWPKQDAEALLSA